MYTMRAELIGHFKACMTEIYLHIDARMADYICTHPYPQQMAVARHTGAISKAEALESVLRISGPAPLVARSARGVDGRFGLSDRGACELINRWVDQLPSMVEALNTERLAGTGISHRVLTTTTTSIPCRAH